MAGIQKYTKEELIGHYILLKQKLRHQPTRGEWDSNKEIPSSKPIRDLFGNWGIFIKTCGDGPIPCFVKDGKKQCNICRKIKGVEEFYKQEGGYMYCCKECWKVVVEVRERNKQPTDKDYDKMIQKWNIKNIWMSKYHALRQRSLGEYGRQTNATGKPFLSEKEYEDWCISTMDIFLSLWGNWVKSGFDRRLTPSIDRINNDGGYSKDNIQWLTMDDNIKKYHQEEAEKRGKVIAEKDGEVWKFNSPKEAYTTLGLLQSKVCQVLNGQRKTTGGYRLYYQK